MYQTIQVSSCLSVQGEFVEALASGEVVVRDGNITYRGRPIKRVENGFAAALINAFELRAIPTREPA